MSPANRNEARQAFERAGGRRTLHRAPAHSNSIVSLIAGDSNFIAICEQFIFVIHVLLIIASHIERVKRLAVEVRDPVEGIS